jgi:hypothetical protein
VGTLVQVTRALAAERLAAQRAEELALAGVGVFLDPISRIRFGRNVLWTIFLIKSSKTLLFKKLPLYSLAGFDPVSLVAGGDDTTRPRLQGIKT